MADMTPFRGNIPSPARRQPVAGPGSSPKGRIAGPARLAILAGRCPHPTRERPLLMPARLLACAVLALLLAPVAAQRYLSGITWPEPPVVTPGEGSKPPSDAIILFDGTSLDE